MKAIMIRTGIALIALLAVWGFYNYDFTNNFGSTKEIDLDNDFIYFHTGPNGAVIHIDKDCSDSQGAMFWTYRRLLENYRYDITNAPFCTKCVSDEDVKRIIAEANKMKMNNENGVH